jgi:hypothetical protein
MQFESWDDAVKRAKAKRDTEDAPEDPVTRMSARSDFDGRKRCFGPGGRWWASVSPRPEP